MCPLKTRRLTCNHGRCFAPQCPGCSLPQPLERVPPTTHPPAKTLTSALSPAPNHLDCGVSARWTTTHNFTLSLLTTRACTRGGKSKNRARGVDERARLCKKEGEESLTCRFCAPGSVARTAEDYHAILVVELIRARSYSKNSALCGCRQSLNDECCLTTWEISFAVSGRTPR